MTTSFKDTIWRNSGLFKKSAQVGPVKHQKSINMLDIEDVSESALPPTSDGTTHISAAEKHQQIGVDPAVAIIKHVADGVVSNMAGGGAFVIVDVNPHTAEFIKAALVYHQECTAKIKVVSYAVNENHHDWLQMEVRSWMIDAFLTSSLKIHGAAPLPES
eukprot:4575029-Karenia_brevis.AAC.1